MQENLITAPPELRSEIESALDILKKHGYQVTARQDTSDDLSLIFKLGENEQTLKFLKNEWQKNGVVQKGIVDKLDI